MKKKLDTVGAGLTRRGFGKGAALLSGTGLLYTAGLAPAIGQGKTDLRVGVFGGDFGNLSPVVRWDIQAGLPIYNIFDPLVATDYANRQIIPSVAEEWSNPDPLTWRIKIREGVQWHRGFGEVTAEDVAYTWNFHIATKSFQLGTTMFVIDTVTVESKYVLEVKLKLPFGAFPGVTLGYGGLLVSANAHQEMGDKAYSANPVGNGAYVVESVRGSEIVLAKNENYWIPDRPKMDRLFYRAIPDSTVRLQALLANELDFLTHPDPKDVESLRTNSDFTTTSIAGWNWDYQEFNLVADNKLPYHDKRVRQAISYAIDREAIVNEIYAGQATITDNQIPPGYLGHRESLMRYPKNGDLKKARELMAEAGVSGYEVEVMTSDKDWLRRELELVAAMVSQIGITYKIRNLDLGGFNNLWFNDQYEQFMEDITLVAPDPDATSWWFMHSQGNASAYNVPSMDELLDSARVESEPERRTKIYHDIVDRTLEECPLIYHLNANYTQVFNKALTGFSPTPQEYIEKFDTISWT